MSQKPFPYQEAFATADALPELVHAPTGAGKTATAVLGWVWRYFHTNRPTPRRLVYCLPMRVLVEQTRDEAEKWLSNLGLTEKVKVHVLMGGEDADEWDIAPEQPAVLIGTQDMLLSRALNRGYGEGRFRWPMHFGLLNNDCLWVLDEIQLMGTGLATSTQLQAFREALGTFGPAKTVWMSATLLPDWLASVDYRDRIKPELRLRTLALDPAADYGADGLRERWDAAKPLSPADVSGDDPAGVARFVKGKHQDGSLTLVIVNTVDRARTVFEELKKLYEPAKRPKGGTPPGPVPARHLVHSRFRPVERKGWDSWLKPTETPAAGRIVVSTQVVEAGVDLSARTLITELAPWPSLVQRFGRCNRRGEFLAGNPAQVFWLDVPTVRSGKKSLAPPYTDDELDAAQDRLGGLSDVGLKSLTAFFDGLSDAEKADLFPFDPAHVVRRKDFTDLFDTTPDLAGNDVDVSRFIRDGDDIDVQVFWRAGAPPKGELPARQAKQLAPVRRELCPVRVGDFRAFVEKVKKAGKVKVPAYWWDALDGEWVPVDAGAVAPGQVFWIPAEVGGYSKELGWSPDAPPLEPADCHPPDADDRVAEGGSKGADLASESHAWQSIAEHTTDVVAVLRGTSKEVPGILDKLGATDLPTAALIAAARWHDWGKAHVVFQNRVKAEAEGKGPRPDGYAGRRDIAKAENGYWGAARRPIDGRDAPVKHFRHELASALGVLGRLTAGEPPADWAGLSAEMQNLALYLIAAHHGKVRLSIRSMPGEAVPPAGALFARGVWEGDELSAVELGDGVTAPKVERLDLSPMRLGRVEGRPSWAERMLGLRDHPDFGPLKLAYLEALLRAADMRASKAADEKAKAAKGGRP